METMIFKIGDHFEDVSWEDFQKMNLEANEQGLVCIITEKKGGSFIPEYVTFDIGPGSSQNEGNP